MAISNRRVAKANRILTLQVPAVPAQRLGGGSGFWTLHSQLYAVRTTWLSPTHNPSPLLCVPRDETRLAAGPGAHAHSLRRWDTHHGIPAIGVHGTRESPYTNARGVCNRGAAAAMLRGALCVKSSSCTTQSCPLECAAETLLARPLRSSSRKFERVWAPAVPSRLRNGAW